MLLTQLSPSPSINLVGYTALGAQQSHLIPLPSLHAGEGSSPPGCVPHNKTLNLNFISYSPILTIVVVVLNNIKM